MRRTGIAAEAGFTLIEVLAACMVLLTGVLGAAELTNVANKSTNISAARNGATSIARRVVEAGRGVPARNLTSAALMSTPARRRPISGTPSRPTRCGPSSAATSPTRSPRRSARSTTTRTASRPWPRRTRPTATAPRPGTTDLQPADFEQVTVNVAWKVRNKPGSVQQVTQVPIGANTNLPAVSQLRMTSPSTAPPRARRSRHDANSGQLPDHADQQPRDDDLAAPGQPDGHVPAEQDGLHGLRRQLDLRVGPGRRRQGHEQQLGQHTECIARRLRLRRRLRRRRACAGCRRSQRRPDLDGGVR